MKIYILTVNQVESPSRYGLFTSSTSFPRYEKKKEYYASKESAERRQKEIVEGVHKLTGFIDNLEVDIQEVEVKP